MRRRLFIFLACDLVVVAALAGWWYSRRQPPGAVANPPAVAQPAPAVPPVGAQPVAPAAASGAPALDAPAGVSELHGTFNGQPFWARLGAPTAELGGKRLLQIVYTPPPAAEVSDSLLHDSPRLVVDDHLTVVAWNNRDGATGIVLTAAPAGYQVNRETATGETSTLLTRKLVGGPAWDLRLAPLLLALAWRADEADRAIRVVDFWGPRAAEKLTLAVHGTAIAVAGESWTVIADDAGRLARLVAADGSEILVVSGRP